MIKIARKALGLLLFLIIETALAGVLTVCAVGIYGELTAPKSIHGNEVAAVITERSGIETAHLQDLVDQKILTAQEAEWLEYDYPLSRQIIWRIMLPAYEIYPYPADLYTDTLLPKSPEDETMQPYTDARVAAIICGLAEIRDDPDQIMTKQEFTELRNQLEAGVTIPPEYEPNLDCPYLSNQTWDAATYRGRNALIVCWDKIPASWREDFMASDWTIDFNIPSTSTANADKTSTDNLAGQLSYQNKTINLISYNRTTPIHEFVHYAAGRLGWNDSGKLKSAFEAEAPALAKILGEYSQKDHQEYLARYISYYIAYPRFRGKLRERAPKTYLLSKQLIINYESLLVHCLGVSQDAPFFCALDQIKNLPYNNDCLKENGHGKIHIGFL